jgi:hypothetical protein
MTEYSKDYDDCVFRDGKLIGEFEAMYRYSDGAPWHQDKQDDWIDVCLTVYLSKDLVLLCHKTMQNPHFMRLCT